MPFGGIVNPSLALSCLSGALRQSSKGRQKSGGNISVRSKYYTLDFASRIGARDYFAISQHVGCDLAGEWVFSKTAFPHFDADDEAYLSRFCTHLDRGTLMRAREHADRFIEETTWKIVDMAPAIVGCTSVFAQNCASLALLRRLKELSPSIVTVMGGGNCEGDMGRELHASFPWVDYVLSGEGDVVFPELCERILSGDRAGIAADDGIVEGLFTPDARKRASREDGEKIGRAVVEDLSALPMPCYDDYLSDLAESEFRDSITPGIVMETSRGCWWGERHACVFCGLNGMSRRYRSKTPERVFEELLSTSERLGIKSFEMTDNMLHLDYVENLFPRLVGGGFHFFYEVTPTLSRSQMKVLSDAGVRWMQPGIEHLHDEGLAAMGKKSKAYQNVRFLKYAREYGIMAVWNFIYDFPFEEADWYGEVAELIPSIVHLQPPLNDANPMHYDRFSRYHATPERYGLNLVPYPSYRFIYPLDDNGLSRIAYYFENAEPRAAQTSPQLVRWRNELCAWKRLFPDPDQKTAADRPKLEARRPGDGSIVIDDTRPCAAAPNWELRGLEAALYDACDAGQTRADLTRVAALKGVDAAEVSRALNALVAARIVAEIGGYCLSLAVDAPMADYLPINQWPGGWWQQNRTPGPLEQSIEEAYRLV
jgi:magnesium-protoporphyrin IX monomethyl ester (oxidative) cyclase